MIIPEQRIALETVYQAFCQSNININTPPKYLTDIHPSNILGVYTPQITDAWACVKYLTDMRPSNILGVYTPQITDAWACVKYLTDIHPSNISGVIRQIYWGCRPPKYLTDIHLSNILGV